MYKKITTILLLAIATNAHALVIGPNLLANSPSDYLVDLASYMADSGITQQIGNDLYSRDFISTVSVLDQTIARFDNPPVAPAPGHTYDDGVWVWIPDALNTQTGIWYWIARVRAAYLQYFYDNIIPF
jgi:hypothetical protein